MNSRVHQIRKNVDAVRRQIAAAAGRCGRDPDAITLVAVTKYVDLEITRLFPQAGAVILGESRPQQLWDKAAALNDPRARWHMIGHLQRNKVRRTLRWVTCVESIDSEALIDVVEKEADKIGKTVRCLLEVNISGDPDKHGFTPAAAQRIARRLDGWPHVRFTGLMGMAARASDAESARVDFANLRRLRDAMQLECTAGIRLADLSMGMSRDFAAAIEEGATIVRVGSALLNGVA